MSQSIQPRIKQIRQKSINNSYPISIPLGADGFLIDMFSGLDLEEELKLGNDHYVEIKDNNGVTEIKEWYFIEKKGDRSIQDMEDLNLITYSTQIIIGNNNINMILYKGAISEEKELHTKNIIITENSNIITIDEEVTP